MGIPHEPFMHARWWRAFAANPYASRDRGPCPQCGGHKRFQLRRFPDGKYAAYCWVCGYTWFATDHEKPGEIRPTPPQRRYVRTPRQNDWLAYYYAAKMPEARLAWWKRGVNAESIYRFRLGYCPQREWWVEGETIRAPSLVIPYFDIDGKLTYIQHRVLGHDERIRYRPEYKSIPPTLWLSTLRSQKKTNITFVVEGAIKAIVLAQLLRYRHPVIAYISNNADKSSLIDVLEAYAPQLVCHLPDPDTATHPLPTREIKQVVICTPDKVDDWIRRERLSLAAFWRYLRQNGVNL